MSATLTTLKTRIDELIAQHGTLRAAARVLEVDPGYLSRLRYGEKDEPGDAILRRMGLRRVVAYERLPRPAYCARHQLHPVEDDCEPD